jgi:hypothetical protein
MVLRFSDGYAESRDQWPKATQGDHQALVQSGQMVLMVVRQGGWTMLTVAKDALMKAKGPTEKWAESQPKKESTYFFSGDVKEVR